MQEVALLRLVAQRIAGAERSDAAEVVAWLTAVQAQNHSGALTSVALRTTARTRQGVQDALNAGQIVKSWPMRGTLHLIVAEDLPWLLELSTTRMIAGAARRRAELGLDLSMADRAGRLAVEALSGGGQVRREELLAAWQAGGLDTAGQRGYHLLWHIAQTGIVCFGPVRDGEPLLVLVDEWIPAPRRLHRDEALGELALRYFRSHGPATVKDFTRWTKLVAADVRVGLALARPQLASLHVDGVEHLMDPLTPDRLHTWRRHAQDVYLLPGFDEYILGYGDRRAVLAAEYANRIVPGGNGVFRPTVISAGQVVGTWKLIGSEANRIVVAEAFDEFSAEVSQAIQRVYEGLPGD